MIFAAFQPIVRLADREVVGYEALARKTDGEREVPLSEWIPEYLDSPERSLKLTEIMFAEIVKALKALPPAVFITVNVEAQNFHIGPWDDIAERTGLADVADRVIAEISERGTIHDSALALAEKARLFNIRIAFDDVGAGSARLIEFVDLAPDMLKLDARICDRLDNERMRIVLRTITDTFRQLGTTTLIEGIETEDQASACRELGIDLGQGFLFGQPGPLQSGVGV